MQYVLYACLLVVPVISVVSFVLACNSMQKVKKLKELTIKLAQVKKPQQDPVQEALQAYAIDDM